LAGLIARLAYHIGAVGGMAVPFDEKPRGFPRGLSSLSLAG
jgi:hypothetical protein